MISAHTDLAVLPQVLDFLEKKGIRTEAAVIDETTFLPGMRIRNGVLQYDPSKLKYPGDLFHEAGHIAVTAAALRPTLSDNVDPEKQSGEELCAILWSYAAVRAAGLPETLVFHPDGYKGDSAWLLATFAEKRYPGMPLLEWMGMAASEATADAKGVAPFPEMISWLRP